MVSRDRIARAHTWIFSAVQPTRFDTIWPAFCTGPRAACAEACPTSVRGTEVGTVGLEPAHAGRLRMLGEPTKPQTVRPYVA